MPRSPTFALAATAAVALALLASLQGAAGLAAAEEQPIKRIPLQRFDVPNTGYETVIGIAEIAAEVNVGRHTHPGPESGYAIEGSFELLVEGEAPRLIRAGDSYMVPANVVHDARSGAEGARVIATYVIPTGQPIATPVE